MRPGTVSPVSVRAPTPTANDFPTPQGQIFNVTKRDQGLVSPAQSSFSFPDEEQPHAISTPRETMEEQAMTKHLDRGSPGDGAIVAATNGTPQQQELRKQKSQFYTEVFSYREPNLSPKDRIYKDSVVMAEVRTNVIVCFQPHSLSTYGADQYGNNRSKTSMTSCKTFHSSCLNGTKDLPLPSSSPSIIQHVSSMEGPSILPTCSLSALSPHSSSLQRTSAMPPCSKATWPIL